MRITGSVSGLEGESTAYVHAFDGDDLIGSDIVADDGAFAFETSRTNCEVVAYQANRRSRRVSVDKGATASLSLTLNQILGSIAGRVTKRNGIAPVPLANVVAVLDGEAAARVAADRAGMYVLTGLDAGIYDIACHVAGEDTIRGVIVSEAETTVVRDFRGTFQTFDRPVRSDDVFQAIKRSYEYDRNQPFGAEVVDTVVMGSHTRETVVYSSTRGQRVEAYVAIPTESGEGPFPCLITLHAGSIIGKERSDFELIRRRMTSVGYAVAAIDAMRFNGRRVPDESGWTWQDASTQTVIDYRRLIDYLSTRAEIDTTRIGIYGGSMGVRHGTLLAGVDDRIKAFVMRGPGLSADRWVDGIQTGDRVQYVPRMPKNIPKILFAGYYDWPWAVQGTIRLTELLDEPAEIVWYHTSHTVPPQLYIDQMIRWVMGNL